MILFKCRCIRQQQQFEENMNNRILLPAILLLSIATQACPDLSGIYLCPANETYGAEKPFLVTVSIENKTQYNFNYNNDGTVSSSTLIADGKIRDNKGVNVKHRCDTNALITEIMYEEEKFLEWSHQEIDSNNNYQVTTGNGITLVCTRQK